MGTRLDIVLPGISEDISDAVCMQIYSELDRIEEKISIYKESSGFSVLNREANLHPVKIDSELFTLINRLIQLSDLTAGYFDFTFGKFSELKTSSSDSGLHVEYIKNMVAAAGIQNILLDLDKHTVFFKTDYLKIDSGGFGKGYGLDNVKKILKAWKIESAFISFGESSILAFGKHPYGTSWKTGIQHILEQNVSLYTFNLVNESLSVSGINPQNIKKHGKGHIFDPHTGKNVYCFRQSAVAGSSGLIAEVISTALICAPEHYRLTIMEQFPEYRAVIIDYDKSNKPSITFTFNADERRTS
jgi:FAD:protein FMN transferase